MSVVNALLALPTHTHCIDATSYSVIVRTIEQSYVYTRARDESREIMHPYIQRILTYAG